MLKIVYFLHNTISLKLLVLKLVSLHMQVRGTPDNDEIKIQS